PGAYWHGKFTKPSTGHEARRPENPPKHLRWYTGIARPAGSALKIPVRGQTAVGGTESENSVLAVLDNLMRSYRSPSSRLQVRPCKSRLPVVRSLTKT